MGPKRVRQAKHEGNVLFKLGFEIQELRLKEGRNFLNEHPASASSWQVSRMLALRRRYSVGEVIAS